MLIAIFATVCQYRNNALLTTRYGNTACSFHDDIQPERGSSRSRMTAGIDFFLLLIWRSVLMISRFLPVHGSAQGAATTGLWEILSRSIALILLIVQLILPIKLISFIKMPARIIRS